MLRPSLLRFLALCLVAAPSAGAAAESLAACTNAAAPFQTLVQLVVDPAVQNPPQVQLCHRAANAWKHHQKERTDKAIDELQKFINEVNRSTPRHLDETRASTLVAEAERIIRLLKGEGEPVLGKVSGGVFLFGSSTPVANALVSLQFAGASDSLTTTTDADGFFSFENIVPAGTFVVTAQDGTGASGSAQGSLLETELTASVTVVVSPPGSGLIQGLVTSSAGQAVPGVLVTALFPDTGRQYTALTGADGRYFLNEVQTDGTVILVAFENDTGASASHSSLLIPGIPSQTINLVLQTPLAVNPELTNSGFVDGLAGWQSSGPVQVIDRGLVFSTPN